MPHRSLRSLATAAALAVSLAGVAVVHDADPAVARATDGVRNGSFDTSRSGWEATPKRRASLSLTSAGHSSRGLLVRKKSARTVTVRTSRRIALSGGAGARYRLTSWLRGSRTGQRVTASVREYRRSKLVRSSRQAVVLRAGTWTPLRVPVTRARSGSTFEVRFTLARGRRADRLVVDQVGLNRVASSTSRPAGCFNSRGVPGCGPVLGSAYGSNSDPTPFESSIGSLVGVRRTFWTASQVGSAVKVAGTDLASGRIPWISFKLPYSWDQMAAGTGDAWAKDLATRLAALPGPVWVAFHHEPEGDGDIAAWTRMQAHLAPLVRSTAPNVAYSIILTGWHELYGDPMYRLANIWPKNTVVDIAGFDVYNSLGVVKDGVMNTKGTDLPSAYFKPLSAWAASQGVAWGLAETGYTDYASQIHPRWIQQTFAAMKSYGGVAFSYFNTTLNSIAPWYLGTSTKVADYAAAQAVSPLWRR